MNFDGSNLIQITESSGIEVYPVFSPDSKHLLIGYDYTITGQWGRYWDMAIIPADFQQYNVDLNKRQTCNTIYSERRNKT